MKWTFTGLAGSSNGQGIGIDNFSITAAAAATPTITGAATATAFTTTYGTASSSQNFSVSGANLTGDITATAPTGFEVSNGGAYGATTTIANSGGTASGTVSLRLKVNAAVSGSYNSVNVALTSPSATTVNITTAASGNAVGQKALSVTASAQSKNYGSAISLGTSAFTSSGLENSETIGAVTLSGSGTAATDPVTTYTITPSAASGGTFTAGNYSISYNTGTLTVNPKTVTITANNVTKPFGNTLTGGSGSSAYTITSGGFVGSEGTGVTVTIAYGTGAASGDAAGFYGGQITPSAAAGGTFTAGNYSISYATGDITVSADPTINVVGTLSAVNTTYGTASASPTSFTVSGIFLTGDLTVAPPSGYEVSLSSGSGYTTSLNITASGTLGDTTVYVRLAATTAAGNYSGNVVVSGGGATSKNEATVSSTVAQKGLTITGLTGVDKPYDRNNTASFTGTPAYSGLENGESFSVGGTGSATFATVTAGVGKTVNVTGYTAPSANYTLTQPSLTATITPIALTVTGATVTSKPYDTTATAAITGGSLVGIISPDVVTIATSAGTFSDANAGTAKAVTAALTLGGADKDNYTLTQPTGLTGDITQIA
ncbi:MAG: YDG domain-containing protein, partial [Verrucomicrobia bacterium]|nr:YDG domain-containing protein [Verrucomicrobiota bacterium]